MTKRKTAKTETPPLPVLYVAERTTRNMVSQPDRITVKRVKALKRGDDYYTFDHALSVGDCTSHLHSISMVDHIVKSGGKEFSTGAVATTPTAALRLLARSVEKSLEYLEAQVTGRHETLDAIQDRIYREAAKSKKAK